MFTMDFTHRLFDGPREQIPAMNRVKAILEKGNFSGTTFPFSKGYAAWETDEVRTNTGSGFLRETGSSTADLFFLLLFDEHVYFLSK